jgi:hypothetical protein
METAALAAGERPIPAAAIVAQQALHSCLATVAAGDSHGPVGTINPGSTGAALRLGFHRICPWLNCSGQSKTYTTEIG